MASSRATVATWRVQGRDRDGGIRDLVPTGAIDEQPPDATLSVQPDRNGALVVTERRLAVAAEDVTVRDGRVVVDGRVTGHGVRTVQVFSRHKKTRSASEPVTPVEGRFEVELTLRHEVYRFGQRPLPTGEHALVAEVTVESGGATRVHEVPVVVAPELGSRLPVAIATDRHEGRVVRGPESSTQIVLQRPIGNARGQYAQNTFRRAAVTPYAGPLHRGLLVRSYFGELATDSGVSVQEELRRRGSDLPVYWAVQDHSVVVPDGGIPVIVNSEEWYRLLSSVSYYLDNMYQPDFHRKPEGQVIMRDLPRLPVQADGPAALGAAGLLERADGLLRPARRGLGLPRLTRDVRHAPADGGTSATRATSWRSATRATTCCCRPTPTAIRAAVRESLGVRPDQTAVLYAPTFRDYMSRDDNQAVMPSFFDFGRAHRRLGDDTVFLIRGHAFNARTKHRVGPRPGTVDVTDYPEVSDLYLAADAAIVDYSSLRFDFGVTGKPMIFHVPDLQRYQDTRGWLFDFEPTAPGPLVTTTDEVVDAIADLAGVREQYAAAYRTFHDEYLDLDDGQAGARLVDAVFVPRGDA